MKLLLAFFLSLPLFAKEFQITAIAAKVNGHAITVKEVNALLAPRQELLRTLYPREGEIYQRRLKQARDNILEQLIDNELLLTEIKGLGANIPDHVVEGEIRRIIRDNYEGDENEFRKFLKDSGQTRHSFREAQREQILVQAYRSQQFKEIPPPTESEIQAQYNKRKRELRDPTKDQIDFQKIFIRLHDPLNPNVNPEKQLAKAEKLALELKGGADFTELAKKNSDGAFAEDGGFWRETPRIDLNRSFGDALFEEGEINKIIGPLKDPAGFTIVKILKIDYGPSPPLKKKEVYERMKKEVNIEKRTARYEKWLESLKRNAMIERRI